MARPVKCRRVCAMPEFREFIPAGRMLGDEYIELRVDEYEAIRLIDYLGLSQEEAAAGMEVSRATIQNMYEAARKKLAAALVEGCLLYTSDAADD